MESQRILTEPRDPFEEWDAVETAQRIKAGEVSPIDVVEAAITRAEQRDPLVAAIVTPAFDQARTAARKPNPGPFGGVPTFVKDLDNLAGVQTRFGSRAVRGYIPQRDSPCIREFLDTGLIALGKSSTPEFGLTCTTEPLAHTPTRNPWALDHSSGGSSGGAAALVAGGVVPIAHASDGGGSIRIPAALCGLVGLKPTRGRLVSIERMKNLPIEIATSGVLTRTVRDTAAFYAAVEKSASKSSLTPIGDVTHPGSQSLRVGFFTDAGLGGTIDPEVVDAVEDTAALLETLGHRVQEVKSPVNAEMADDFLLYWACLAWGTHHMDRRLPNGQFEPLLLEPWTRGLGRWFRRRAWKLPKAIWRLKRYGRRRVASYQEIDVLLCPTTSTPAPPIGRFAPDQPFADTYRDIQAFVPFTPAQNVSGVPAISLPMGQTKDGRPIGVQLSADHGAEAILLALALALEEAHPWQTLAPLILAPNSPD